MINQELSKIFYEIANFLKTKEIPFKPYAYQKAALTLKKLREDVSVIYRKGGIKALEELPSIGESIAQKIEEYLRTGKIKYYQELKKKMPVKMEELTSVEGVGPRTVKILYKELKIKNLKDLEKAVKSHKIAGLSGLGEKTEKNILQSISFLKKNKGRFLLGDVLSKVEKIKKRLKTIKEVEKISEAGSVRRKKETIGDIDFLISIKNSDSIRKKSSDEAKKIMDFFVSMPGVVKTWGKGETKSSIMTKQGLEIDLRVVPEKSFGAALQYFTGSKEHNIATRKIAMSKGLKLNEYGVFRGRKMIAGKSEKEIYESLGMQWIPPEIREDRGEVRISIEGKLPELLELKDIKGDLHSHSSWDGGRDSISEMAKACINRGYKYLGISDHTKFLRIEHGLDEKELLQQRKKIIKINLQLVTNNSQFRVLQGAETNVLSDGSLDIKDEVLKKLDYVIAGVHSSFKMSRERMTKRIIKAIKNPYVRILSHPTGRLLKQRDEYLADWDKIFKAAKDFGVILEINAHPKRLDLNDRNIRIAKEMGIKMAINSDAHHISQFENMKFGVFQARRGWAEKNDIVNTFPLNKLLNLWK